MDDVYSAWDKAVDDLILCIRTGGDKGRKIYENILFEKLTKVKVSPSHLAHRAIIKEIGNPASVCTEVDLLVRDLIKKWAFLNCPGLKVIGEEESYNVPGDLFKGWTMIIDEWDGSFNGVRGSHLCGISIAVDDESGPFQGFWYDPYRELMIFNLAEGIHLVSPNFNQGRGFDFSEVVKSTTAISKSRVIIVRGNGHQSLELIEPPLSILRSSVLMDLNYGSATISLMSVALGINDGLVMAGLPPWDIWAARPIFNALKIPYAFLEPWTYRDLQAEEIVPDPEKKYAFCCANNQTLFEEIMQILQNCRTIRFPRTPEIVGSEWPEGY